MIFKEKALIKDPILNPYGNLYFNNTNLIHVEQNMKILKSIYDKQTPYFPAAYSILVHQFEQLYKGLITFYTDNNPTIEPFLDFGHRLDIGAIWIDDNICPIIQNTNNKKNFLYKLNCFSSGYTRSVYHDIYDYAEFAEVYRYFVKQREYLYQKIEELIVEYQKNPVQREEEEKEILDI